MSDPDEPHLLERTLTISSKKEGDRRALPFRVQGGRRRSDVDRQSYTELVVTRDPGPVMPFEQAAPRATLHQLPSVWAGEAVIDPHDLPSSLAPWQISHPTSVAPQADDMGRAVAALVMMAVAVVSGIAVLALFALG